MPVSVVGAQRQTRMDNIPPHMRTSALPPRPSQQGKVAKRGEFACQANRSQGVPSSIDWRVTEILPSRLFCPFAPLLPLSPSSFYLPICTRSNTAVWPPPILPKSGEVGRSDVHANMDGENGRGIPHPLRDVPAHLNGELDPHDDICQRNG